MCILSTFLLSLSLFLSSRVKRSISKIAEFILQFPCMCSFGMSWNRNVYSVHAPHMHLCMHSSTYLHAFIYCVNVYPINGCHGMAWNDPIPSSILIKFILSSTFSMCIICHWDCNCASYAFSPKLTFLLHLFAIISMRCNLKCQMQNHNILFVETTERLFSLHKREFLTELNAFHPLPYSFGLSLSVSDSIFK